MQKVVGQPCPTCGVPFIQGKNGAYCKPCYIKWADANKAGGQQNTTRQSTPVPAKDEMSIYRSVALKSMTILGKMTKEDVEEMNRRVEYLKTGQLVLKQLSDSRPNAPAQPDQRLDEDEILVENIPF